MSLLAVLVVIYGLKRIAADGAGWWPALSIVAGLGFAVVFARRQRKLPDPLVDVRLFRVPAFSASLATYLLGTFVAFGAFLFIAQYLQLVLGLSPLQAGVRMVPFFVAFVVGSTLAPVMARRVRPAVVMVAGLVVATVGFGVLTRVDGGSSVPVLVAGSVVFSLGLAPVFTLANDLVIGTAPPERAGAAAAISETSSELGGALGIAVLGSIGAAAFRRRVADVLPDGVPPEAAAAARDTLGAALAVSERLPGHLGAELVEAARGAFAHSLELTATICAFLLAATAVVALGVLRRAQPGARGKDEPARTLRYLFRGRARVARDDGPDRGRRAMCRNIRVLYNFEPPTTREEIRAAALQYVRKVSGLQRPAAADGAAFEEAIDAVAASTERLLGALQARTAVRTREQERQKARARWERREASPRRR